MEKIIKFSNHKQCFVFLGWNFPFGNQKNNVNPIKKNFGQKNGPKLPHILREKN
jgi:hypothetical protein